MGLTGSVKPDHHLCSGDALRDGGDLAEVLAAFAQLEGPTLLGELVPGEVTASPSRRSGPWAVTRKNEATVRFFPGAWLGRYVSRENPAGAQDAS